VTSAVELEGLGRTYRVTTGVIRRQTREITALNGVTWSVPAGRLVGVLGPNGAGKTTLIKILATLLLPTSGRARVFGIDVTDHPWAVRRATGLVLGGDRGLYYRLSGRDNLRYFAALYQLPGSAGSVAVERALSAVGLVERASERVETYSRGMKQRLHIARALLHHPQIFLLDEPTLGLDPVAARELRETIGELRAAGSTVVLTTHYMHEAEQMCDEVIVISRGRIVAQGSPNALRALVPNASVIELELAAAAEPELVRLVPPFGMRMSQLDRSDGVVRLQIRTRSPAAAVEWVIGSCGPGHLRALRVREASLEDAYVTLVGDAHP
jgi:ABC-2 type transport system ATP-binding protein